MLTAVIAVLQLCALVNARSFLTMNSYATALDCSADAEIQSSFVKEIGICNEIPDGMPPTLGMVKSYTLDSCVGEDDDEFVAAQVSMFTGPGCSGIKIEHTMDDVIPSGCIDNAFRVKCEDTPISMVEKWPSVAVFVNDDRTEYSLSVNCPNPDEMQITMFTDTLICSEGEGFVMDDRTVDTDTCNYFQEIEIPDMEAPNRFMNRVFMRDDGEYSMEVYYKAMCDGY